jgi:hypothetical protein
LGRQKLYFFWHFLTFTSSIQSIVHQILFYGRFEIKLYIHYVLIVLYHLPEMIFIEVRDLRYRDADAGLRKLTTGRNADAGLNFFWHYGISLLLFKIL